MYDMRNALNILECLSMSKVLEKTTNSAMPSPNFGKRWRKAPDEG